MQSSCVLVSLGVERPKPLPTVAARRCHHGAVRLKPLCMLAVAGMILLTFFELPYWCRLDPKHACVAVSVLSLLVGDLTSRVSDIPDYLFVFDLVPFLFKACFFRWFGPRDIRLLF